MRDDHAFYPIHITPQRFKQPFSSPVAVFICNPSASKVYSKLVYYSPVGTVSDGALWQLNPIVVYLFPVPIS